MATIVNMHEAKSTLSKLVAKAAAGEEVVIAKAGKPVAKLVKYEQPARRLGLLEGKIWIADDFDEPDEELIALFEGSDDEEF
ncbi:MAG TPA: type II toxin-antitoxin system prevent-host-death family antitoxin [Gaiellaceae bacterium]|nr:type II toxin-antitoxin system prevent-host-death family antitoxin [Gaiellaceae bacterium]